MKVILPDKLEMTCPKCRETYVISAASMNRRAVMYCPYCGEKADITDCLPTRIKRQIYHALRDELEQKVYLKYRELNADSDDQWSAGSETD